MRPGVVVANRFRIERIAGVGGMGTVFQATDLVAGGSVALKILTGIGEHDAARFVREAVVLAELVHPGIVRYLAHGLTTDHEHYLAMEWLEGETLHDRLGRGRLSVAEALVLGRALAEALAVAHARGVVHRDIKPMNLFLPGGELAKLKVLDFGIARLVKQVGMLTHTGAVIGTPGYMAPEQVRGETDVDASTDVFGVGCVLYHCLTGVPAFAGNPIAVLAKILLEDVRPLGELVAVPRELDELVLAMLHKDRSARPANGRVVASELARIAAGELSEELSSTVVSVGTLAATATTGSRVGVTAFERRLVSLVLMLPIAESSDEELHQVAMVATTYRGKLVRIVDGANLVVFGHAETAPDHAARAARCALALRELHPTARYVVASGRAAVGAHLVGEVIDRAVAESVGAPSGQIVIDDATSHLLDERFAIEGDRYLWGSRTAPSTHTGSSAARACSSVGTARSARSRRCGLRARTIGWRTSSS